MTGQPETDREWKFQRAVCVASVVLVVLQLAIGWPFGAACCGFLAGVSAALWLVEYDESRAGVAR